MKDKTNNTEIEKDTIETWKLDISELIFCMVNGKPSKLLGYIPSQRDINDYITAREADIRREAVMGLVLKIMEKYTYQITLNDLEEETISYLKENKDVE